MRYAWIDKVTVDDLAKFREKWDLAPSTAGKKLERLRSFFKFCVDRGWIEKNPAKSLRPPKESVIERKPYKADELEKIAGRFPCSLPKGSMVTPTVSASRLLSLSCGGPVCALEMSFSSIKAK